MHTHLFAHLTSTWFTKNWHSCKTTMRFLAFVPLFTFHQKQNQPNSLSSWLEKKVSMFLHKMCEQCTKLPWSQHRASWTLSRLETTNSRVCFWTVQRFTRTNTRTNFLLLNWQSTDNAFQFSRMDRGDGRCPFFLRTEMHLIQYHVLLIETYLSNDDWRMAKNLSTFA